MALTLQNDGAALASGAPMPNGTRRVRVLRPFMYGGKPTEVGDELDLPKGLAADMVFGNKAEWAAASKPVAAPRKKEG